MELVTLTPPAWDDYTLLDSGDGKRLEQYGSYRIVRPDSQAIWQPHLPAHDWQTADARFEKRGSGDDSAGDWVMRQKLPDQWQLHHNNLRFWVRLTPFRHTGVFPEHSAHWAWMRTQLARISRPRALILFGYTGLHTLVAAEAGAFVCHVDASKPATRWAQANQELSGLQDRPVRWIVDDALKFVAREARRNSRYDLIVMDPPVFGRGPKGEIWRLQEALHPLLQACVDVLSERAVGLLLNAYATSLSPLTLANVMQGSTERFPGSIAAGEMALHEQSGNRLLPAALFARWTAA